MAKAESKETVGKRLRVTDLIPRICCVFCSDHRLWL